MGVHLRVKTVCDIPNQQVGKILGGRRTELKLLHYGWIAGIGGRRARKVNRDWHGIAGDGDGFAETHGRARSPACIKIMVRVRASGGTEVEARLRIPGLQLIHQMLRASA